MRYSLVLAPAFAAVALGQSASYVSFPVIHLTTLSSRTPCLEARVVDDSSPWSLHSFKKLERQEC